MNRAVRRTALAPWMLALASILLAAELFLAPGYIVLTSIFAGGVWFAARVVDLVRRNYFLRYKLDALGYVRWQALTECLRVAADSSAIWQIVNTRHARPYTQAAGGFDQFDRRACKFGSRRPPCLGSSIAPMTFHSGDFWLAFLPDQLYVFENDLYRVIEYSSLVVTYSTENMVEAGRVPKDAKTIGRTWKHFHSNGSPDRALSGTHMAPVVQYGRVWFHSPQGLDVSFCFSSLKAAESVARMAYVLGQWDNPVSDQLSVSDQQTAYSRLRALRCW